MKAIVTKYLGPTNTRGAVIRVSAEGVKSRMFAPSAVGDYNPIDVQHAVAAREFARMTGWLEGGWDLASGTLPDGRHCHVFVRKWNGMCPANRHGLDYETQACDLCAKENA